MKNIETIGALRGHECSQDFNILISAKKMWYKKTRLIDRFVIEYLNIRNQCQAALLPDNPSYFAIFLLDY